MRNLILHPNAALFQNPDDHRFLMAPDLEDASIAWTWPNELHGWSKRVKATEHPRELNATALDPEIGRFSGWPGCREETAEEKAEKRRPPHRPPLAYEQKVAHLHLRTTNGQMLVWARAAAIAGLTVEDWVIAAAQKAAGVASE